MRAINLVFLIWVSISIVSCSGGYSSSSGGSVPTGTTTFTVTAADAPSAYDINGVANGSITLQRGQAYTFNISTSGHPFYFTTVEGSTGGSNAYTGNGLSGSTTSGSVSFTPDGTTPS